MKPSAVTPGMTIDVMRSRPTADGRWEYEYERTGTVTEVRHEEHDYSYTDGLRYYDEPVRDWGPHLDLYDGDRRLVKFPLADADRQTRDLRLHRHDAPDNAERCPECAP